MSTSVYFDMDGTLADLYNFDKWLEYIECENETPFYNCEPIGDTSLLNKLIEDAKNVCSVVGVITWLPKNASRSFCKKVEKAKKAWLKIHFPSIPLENVHVLPYGEPKQHANIKRSQRLVLVDDNAKVREEWRTTKQRIAISEKEMINFLNDLVFS